MTCYCNKLLIGLMLYLAAVLPVRAADDTSSNGYELGVAFAMPAVGVSLRKVFNDRYTGALVVGSGFQVQLNFTRGNPMQGYYLLGFGKNSDVELIRAGYGYKWKVNNFSIHLEATLNIPFFENDSEGLAGLGRVAYFFPLGVGVHYNF